MQRYHLKADSPTHAPPFSTSAGPDIASDQHFQDLPFSSTKKQRLSLLQQEIAEEKGTIRTVHPPPPEGSENCPFKHLFATVPPSQSPLNRRPAYAIAHGIARDRQEQRSDTATKRVRQLVCREFDGSRAGTGIVYFASSPDPSFT